MNTEEFLREFDESGYSIVENVLTPEYVEKAKHALELAISKEAKYHGTTEYGDYGMVLCCVQYDLVFIELFENERFLQPFEAVLGPGCIVYANTSSSMPPNKGNFSTRIHVDCPRFIDGYSTNMGATVLLDDFRVDNGGTLFLAGSHKAPGPPDESLFSDNAERVVASAGSVFYFDGRLWHAGGTNHSSSWRHSVTVNMCRPYMKQRLDIPRILADRDLTGVSERAMQKLGFHAQTPASLKEYYAPPNERKFRQPYE